LVSKVDSPPLDRRQSQTENIAGVVIRAPAARTHPALVSRRACHA